MRSTIFSRIFILWLISWGVVFSSNSSSTTSLPTTSDSSAAKAEVKSGGDTGLLGTPSKAVQKNLARYNVGTILEKFDRETRFYLTDPSGAAWLDEDDATTYTLPAGKQWYLLTLENPELVQNFSIAGEGLAGKISLYASDQKAVPGAKSWDPLFKNVDVESINEKEYQKPLYRYARYFLIETDLQQAVDVSSLYLFTDTDASTYRIVKRAQPVRFVEKAGPFYKDPKGQVNFLSRYARASQSLDDQNLAAMTDESPETTGSLDQKPTTIDLKVNRQIERISLSAEKRKGAVSFSLQADQSVPSSASFSPLPDAVRLLSNIGWQRLGSMLVQSVSGNGGAISDSLSRSVVMDGKSSLVTVQMPVTSCRYLTMSWSSGENPSAPLKIKNISAMGYISLNEFHVNRGLAGGVGASNNPSPTGQSGETKENTLTEIVGQTKDVTRLSGEVIPEVVPAESTLNLPPVTPVSN